MEPARPSAVVAAAALLYISGGAALLLGCAGALVGEGSASGYLLKLAGFGVMGIGLFEIWLARLTLRGRAWARVAAVVLAVAGAVLVIVPPLVDDDMDPRRALVGVVLNLSLAGTLLTPSAREYFAASRDRR